MNPYLSWGLLTLCAGAAYIYVNGLPKQLLDTLANTRDASRHRITSAATKTKRKARATQKPKNIPAPQATDEGRLQATADVLRAPDDGVKRDRSSKADLKDHRTNGKVGGHVNQVARASKDGDDGNPKGQKISPASWYRRDVQGEAENDSDDPVKNVMLGRPRKVSTPIGRSKNVPTIQDANGQDNGWHSETPSDVPGEQKRHLAEAQWQTKRRSHVVDDMLESDTSFAARTLKITPAASKPVVKTAGKSKGTGTTQDVMTKKQRQNAAKKEKLKAEKIEFDRRQATVLRAHKQNLEAQRVAEISQFEKNTESSRPPASSGAWDETDWKTVAKSKKVSNGQNAAVDSNGKLIWE